MCPRFNGRIPPKGPVLPKISILVIFFNRPSHLTVLVDRLVFLAEQIDLDITFFGDGPRRVSDHELLFECRRVISDRFPRADVYVNEYNRGLRKNIVEGISYCFTKNIKSLVVLEDDCIPSIGFFQFILKNSESLKTHILSGFNPINCEYGDPVHETDFNFCWGWAVSRDIWALNSCASKLTLIEIIRAVCKIKDISILYRFYFLHQSIQE